MKELKVDFEMFHRVEEECKDLILELELELFCGF